MRNRRTITMLVALVLAFAAMTGPALADHDHKLLTPGGCVPVPVGHQDHGPDDPGLKFHGGAHVGPAVGHKGPGEWPLGQGNSQVTVDGGAC